MTRPLAFVLLALGAVAPAAERRNVLLIVCDDLHAGLGCFGTADAHTPRIDDFARSAVRFERAYCQYPLCNPSRASFLTGLRPEHTGVRDNAVHFRKAKPDAVTLPQAFQNAGYTVARVGKLYHYGVPNDIGTDGMDDPPSWQKVINPKGRDRAEQDRVIQLHNPPKQMGGSLCYYEADGTDAEQTDGLIAAETIGLLQAYRDKPFFLACGFFRPHVPCVAPHKYYAMHPVSGLRLPNASRAGAPPAAFAAPPHYGLPENQLLAFLQGYKASVSFVDAQVGRVLAELDRLDLAKSTVVVVMSDHGWLTGQHAAWQKMSLFEESARVPLLIRTPGLAGGVCPSPVELVDLYPTLTELCGVTAPALDGHSLRGRLERPDAASDRPAFTEVQRGAGAMKYLARSVRTQRWRYTEWDGGAKGAELYDHDADPGEFHNLAKEPGHADSLAMMKRLLQGGR